MGDLPIDVAACRMTLDALNNLLRQDTDAPDDRVTDVLDQVASLIPAVEQLAEERGDAVAPNLFGGGEGQWSLIAVHEHLLVGCLRIRLKDGNTHLVTRVGFSEDIDEFLAELTDESGFHCCDIENNYASILLPTFDQIEEITIFDPDED